MPLIVLDADKKGDPQIDVDYSSVPAGQRPAMVFLGKENNDLESCFLDESFLAAYFSAHPDRLVPSVSVADIVKTAVAGLKPSGATKDKGSTLLADLHASLWGANFLGRTKADYLQSVMAFLIDNWDAPHGQAVRAGLTPLIAALDQQ